MTSIEERLLKKDDTEVFVASDGMKALRVMSEQKRRQEASNEIIKLKKEIASLQIRNKDLYQICKDSDQWEE